MKKETFDKGKDILETLSKVQSTISNIIDGRGAYYNNSEKEWKNDGKISMTEITISCLNWRNNHSISKLNFELKEESGVRFENGLNFSSEAVLQIESISSLYYETICNIFLKEEKRLQEEFKNLKD